MANTANLKNVYAEQIAPALMKQFNYSSPMQIPVLKKIVVNQGLGDATADKKLIEISMTEIAQITGQKARGNDVEEGHLELPSSQKMPSASW
jgi:large subunit ribosomal protein L5